ncbi:DUF317 domain-containing protein [Streptomyces malaysiensis]|uniref:DUF317 domain-containing protein n=1 Tax=Streptomyces malaysiensis TaxID=92644 RepID=A0A7X5X2X6_STRMQ|nr:DUF317 domain-containing protein [Streptomyces malaysiensis]NIY65629.1 hypothetical protein [Streptomyces malaysiensis]
MTTPAIDAHVRLDTHPRHSSAVTATLTGTRHDLTRGLLTAHGFEALDHRTLVMARIDREEPHWAEKAAHALTGEGITVEITTRLREAIDEEWEWANYPMPWCTREEVREVSNEAQKLYDDIRRGGLLIHAHAEDSHTIVAVGTYLATGKSIHLHGENHLRQIADVFDSPAQALVSFERLYGTTMRPGPAPMTDTEREAAEARTSLVTPPGEPEPPTRAPKIVPAHATGPGDHNAVLDEFLAAHDDWEKWRTWSDDTTHAIHESQTLRIEHVHEAHLHETAWTVAAYETPVSDRAWHLSATGSTPVPVLQTLLGLITDNAGWDTPIGRPVDEQTITAAAKPLTDAGWKHTVDGRWTRWTNPSEDAGVQFDAFAAQRPDSFLATWTIWAGPSIDQPTWAIHASPYAPAPVIAGLAAALVHDTGVRHQQRSRARPRPPQLTAVSCAAAPTGPSVQPGRLR